MEIVFLVCHPYEKNLDAPLVAGAAGCYSWT